VGVTGVLLAGDFFVAGASSSESLLLELLTFVTLGVVVLGLAATSAT